MKKILLTLIVALFVLINAFSQGFYKLDWSDEFNGNALDLTKWSYQIGTGSSEGLTDWGNNEKQYYREENAVVANGVLTITAKKEPFGNKQYTSARITTRGIKGSSGLYTTTFGRIEAKISLPAVTGMWPAFWMLPQNSPYGGWARSGEIDIMEAKGRLPDRWAGTIHYGGNWPNNQWSSIGDKIFPNGKTIADYHVYAIEWTADKISWFCNGIKVGEKTQWYADASNPKPAPFDVPFYILLNLAVGGNYDGNRMPPEDFVSGDMKVDYVRSYRWSDTLTEPEIPETTGLQNSEFVSINAFQVGDNIFIRSENNVRKAILYSLDGQMLLSKSATEIIPIDRMSKGAYILKVEDVFGNQKSIKVMIR
jgi:beta-glucanase (GH16 family)